MNLRAIYEETLQRCAPEALVGHAVPKDAPRNVVAIGKAAGALLDGVAAVHEIEHAIAALPRGYKMPSSKARIFAGGHPSLTADSFHAGRRIIEFVDRHDDILFLISGGGSACVEVPLSPWFNQSEVADANDALVASGLPIGSINVVRKHLSAIKGGRLAARVDGRSVTLVYSDVSSGAIADVASGPTLADGSTKEDAIRILESLEGCDRIVTKLRDASVPGTVHYLDNASARLVADNDTLTAAAAAIAGEHGFRVVRWPGQIEMDVAEAADLLAQRAANLEDGEVLVAGGEPTVVRHGNGRGGRCSELAVRFALAADARGIHGVRALFASTDGLDGNSGVAGILIHDVPAGPDRSRIAAALGDSDSFAIAAQIGEPIMITPSGNNLRDLFLVARG